MSALYPYYKQTALDIGNTDRVDMNTDTIKVALYDSYTYDATDKYLTDIGTGTLIATSGALASPTVVNGTFDAADKTVVAVPGGHTITDLIIFKDTGVAGTSTVIANIDLDQAG